MNKIIPSISVIVLCGCSAQQIRTSDVSNHIERVKTQPLTASESSRNHSDSFKNSSPTISQAKRRLIAERPFRHHSIIPVTRSEKHEEPSKQESLIPRITRYIKQGIASWYGPRFHGRKTATGEIFDMYAMTAAHKTLPIPSYAQVTNLENNRSIIVRINDRGPYVGDRLLDLSYAAAKKLGFDKEGLGKVEIVSLTEDQAVPQLRNDKDDRDEKNLFHQHDSVMKNQRTHDEIAVHQVREAKIPSLAYKKSTF